MTFKYQGKNYDLRLMARYLPAGIRNINKLDLALLLSNRGVDKEYKQKILREYLPEAVITSI